jgi:hypothetical protein
LCYKYLDTLQTGHLNVYNLGCRAFEETE